MLLVYTTTIGACTKKQRAHFKFNQVLLCTDQANKTYTSDCKSFLYLPWSWWNEFIQPIICPDLKITDSKSILYFPPIWQNKFIKPISCQSFIVQIHFDKIIHTPSIFFKLKNLLQTHFSFSIDVTKQIHFVQTLKFRCNLAK